MQLRTILLVLASLAFLSASVGGYLYYSSLKESTFREAETKGTLHAEEIRNQIASNLAGNQKAVTALAGLKELQRALLSPNKDSLVEANSVLDHFYRVLECSVCYLMDSAGNTIAASNRNTPDSFVGKNCSFRPYFQRAIKGIPAVYTELGATLRKRGVFYSHPVCIEKETTPIGVVVIESSFAVIEEELRQERGGIALLTDPNGVIFASSRKDWLYHELWQITPEKAFEIAESRQFGEGPWSWTGLKKKKPGLAVDQSGSEYLVYQMSIDNCPGWNIIYLISLGTINKKFIDPLIKTSGSIILVLCFLIGLPVLLLYREASEDIMQRKKTEEALRDSEENFRTLFEHTPGIAFVIDENTRLIAANSLYRSILGDHVGTKALEREGVSKATREFWHKIEKQVIDSGWPAWYTEIVEIHKRGTVYYENRLRPIKRNGKVTMVIGVAHDITERKRIEETLKESEAKLKAMLESMGDHISMMDKELNIIWANKTAKQVFGGDIIGKKCYEAYHQREKPCEPYPCLTLKVFADGEIHKHNTQVIDKEGKTRYFHCTASAALKDKDGKPAAVIEISRDITECRQAVEERIRLATAVEQAAESVIISDRQGTIQYVNPAFELLSGFTREDIVGKNFRVLKSDKHDESFYRNMWETITKGEAWAGRISNRMKDGSLREFETTISPIRDNTGAIVNFVSVNRDVTQEVALEAQLLHAQKMEAVGTLAGGIAHDFNNLLQVIRGYTEVLLNALNKDHSGYEQLQKIHRSAKRGAELTRQLLTFSRKVQSERRPLDLNQEVKLVKNLLERTIPKMIEIELHLNEAPAIVSADPIQVEQALMNLAVNAMDAMPEGGKLVMETEKVILDERFCKTHLGAKPGEYILLSISDTGHGMNREMLEHVFEPFYTTKEVGKGTGLGLAMVYGIVKNHEGYILCYSEPNTGTTFKIYLPALEQDGHWRKMSDREHYIRGGNETILLVDDEDYIRELGTELLTDAGYKVITATDGENGLEIYRKQLQRIDLVILDLVIPGMGGKRCYEEILKINPRAKILIVSGYSADGPGKEALEAGARGFVGKPFDVSHMLDTVREILDQD